METDKRLAFSVPTNSTDEQRTLFESYKGAGYSGLQLKGGQYSRYLNNPHAFLDEWGSDVSLVSGLIYGGDLSDDARGLRSVIKFAHAVSAERIIFCHGESRDGMTKSILRGYARTLSGLASEARAIGVALSLHNHYDQPVMSASDMEVFFENVELDTLTLTVDTAHFAKAGVDDIATIIRIYEPFVDNIHLKDISAGHFRMLGDGSIDFGTIFKTLAEIEYTGWLCADEESGASIKEGLRKSSAYIAELSAGLNKIRSVELG